MKILCPFHNDTEPSCHIYEDHYHCYVCQSHGPLSAIPELGGKLAELPKEKPRENLEETRAYINTLDEKEIRGLRFKYDAVGFYILWPDSLYYKHRLFHPETNSSKYRNPTGHSQPLLWVRRKQESPLYLVEGELNAISLSLALEVGDIVSAGSASNMASQKVQEELLKYISYRTIVLVVDRDPAGTSAAIQLKSSLQNRVPYTSILLMNNDCNEILCTKGKEALRETIQMSTRL